MESNKRRDAEDFRDGPARAWRSRAKTARQSKTAYRDLLRNLGPVTQECSAEKPSVFSVASGSFGLLLPWLGR